jgi:hypothetical protein
MAARTTVYSCLMTTNTSIDDPNVSTNPEVQAFALQFPVALASAFGSLLVPALLLYLAIYTHVTGRYSVFKLLTFSSISAFLALPFVTPVQCAPVQSLQYTASMLYPGIPIAYVWIQANNQQLQSER